MENLTYHFVQIRELFQCRQRDEQKHLALVTYMDVVEPFDSTEDLIGCPGQQGSANNDSSNISMPVVPNPKETPAPWCNIINFQNVKSVVQIVRRNHGIANNIFRVHMVTLRFRLNRFVKLGNAVD